MRTEVKGLFVVTGAALLAAAAVAVAVAQQPGGGEGGPCRKQGGGARGQGPGGGQGAQAQFRSANRQGAFANVRGADEQGPPPGQGSGPPSVGHVLPPFVRDSLDLSSEQQTKIASLEQEVEGRLNQILTKPQIEQFESLLQQGPPPRRGGPGANRDDRRQGNSQRGQRGQRPRRPPPTEEE